MKKIVENGVTYFVWESHELRAKDVFEKAIQELDYSVLVKALLEAMKDQEYQAGEAWRQVKQLAGISMNALLHYDQISQRIKIIGYEGDGVIKSPESSQNSDSSDG
jgi:hypothetical protein